MSYAAIDKFMRTSAVQKKKRLPNSNIHFRLFLEILRDTTENWVKLTYITSPRSHRRKQITQDC